MHYEVCQPDFYDFQTQCLAHQLGCQVFNIFNVYYDLLHLSKGLTQLLSQLFLSRFNCSTYFDDKQIILKINRFIVCATCSSFTCILNIQIYSVYRICETCLDDAFCKTFENTIST
ncbi:unnamed protein product [Paramecium pentaurelia]|uniref:Uncharacterized protein n=1 Tax=Paramecium pentaurelia TaxID=43138 RepID=A0A8S1TKA7_9CILI|nr:unnamed protein product [Paramecium pentaurelia]